MKNTIKNIIIREVVKDKRRKREPKQSNAERFNEWMKSKIQSVYYSDNQQMLNAFKKL